MSKVGFAVFLFFTFSSLQAQSVDKIVSKYLEAMGGVQKLKSVQTVQITQKVVTGDPANGFEFVIIRKRGNKFRMEESLRPNSSEIPQIEGCDGQNSWTMFGPGPAKLGGNFCDGPAEMDDLLLDYKEKGYAVELLGEEKIEGRDLYHLRLTRSKSKGHWTHSYVDAKTFLLDRIVTEADGMHREDVYSDYRTINGIMVAFSDEMRWWAIRKNPLLESKAASLKADGDAGQQKQIVERIEFDVPFDDSIFKMPESKTPTPGS